LLSALEERYQIEIDESEFTAATTVEEIERIVRGEMRGPNSGVAGSLEDHPGAGAISGTMPREVQERGSQQLDTGPNPKSEIRNPKFPYPYPKWSRRFPLTWLRVLLFYSIILPITRVMSRLRVDGSEHLDSLSGPALFVANHVTLGDHALILAALPPRLRHRLAIAMEGERLRDWLYPPTGTSWFMRLRLLAQYALVTTFFPVFPLPKQSGFRRAFAYAGECVDRGESVLVFPEGERAKRGQMHMDRFRPGIGLLVKELNVTNSRELNVPVVPIKLHGLYELKRRQQYFAPPGMVSVVFGEPLKFDPRLDPTAIAEELQQRLKTM
jgi:long-chain acyl-CoA synthetase